MPDGIEAHLSALKQAGVDVGVGRNGVTEVIDLRVSPRGDRVFVATEMALHIWTPDGTPILSASLGA